MGTGDSQYRRHYRQPPTKHGHLGPRLDALNLPVGCRLLFCGTGRLLDHHFLSARSFCMQHDCRCITAATALSSRPSARSTSWMYGESIATGIVRGIGFPTPRHPSAIIAGSSRRTHPWRRGQYRHINSGSMVGFFLSPHTTGFAASCRKLFLEFPASPPPPKLLNHLRVDRRGGPSLIARPSTPALSLTGVPFHSCCRAGAVPPRPEACVLRLCMAVEQRP